MTFYLHRITKTGNRRLLSEHYTESDARAHANKRRGTVIITDSHGRVIPWREQR